MYVRPHGNAAGEQGMTRSVSKQSCACEDVARRQVQQVQRKIQDLMLHQRLLAQVIHRSGHQCARNAS